MSYCRFSTDDFACDVYVYEDCGGGFTTHVAGNRVVPVEPLPAKVPFDKDHFAEWIARDRAVMAILERSPRTAIGLPHDGGSFNDPDAGACADRLESLKALGYNVPQFAIDALRQEATEA